MINETKTFELFGYTSDSLSKGSGKKIIVVCDNCGEENLKRFVDYNNAKYPNLCQSCSSKGEKGSNWKGGLITKKCDECGKDFNSHPHLNQKFCSKKCASKYISENLNGKNHPNYGKNNPNWCGGLVIKICDQCGKEFEVKQSRKLNAKFCSDKCKYKSLSENRRGDKNPSWLGGIIDQKYCYKFNKTCRESNRNKYDRKCFICGKNEEDNGRKLSVHHVDMNNNQGCNSDWKLVPLCQSCHVRAHNDLWEGRLEYLLK